MPFQEPGVEEEAEAADNADAIADSNFARDVPSYATMRTPVKSRSHGALASTHSTSSLEQQVHTATSMGTIHGDTKPPGGAAHNEADRKPPTGKLQKQHSVGSELSGTSGAPATSSGAKGNYLGLKTRW